MQPQDSLSVSRRALDVEDYIDIARRHKSWIFGPVFGALVLSVVVAFLWPDTYVSEAVIRVVPPQVSESLVPSTVTSDLTARVNSMAQTILSRATLTNIINVHSLYQKERARIPLDDVVENMRSKDVKIGSVQLSMNDTGKMSYPAFKISFAYNNRFVAQKVTTDLVARFLEENQRLLSSQTQTTDSFLKDEYQTAKSRLDDIENKLSVFRSKNMGRLPEEQAANYSHLNTTQTEMLNISAQMSRISQEKLLLENQLRTYKDQFATLKDPSSLNSTVIEKRNEKLAEKDKEIAQIDQYLTQLKEHYKETYPDVQAAETRLATAKKQREQLLKDEANKKPDTTATAQHTVSPAFVKESRDLEAAIKQLQAQIQVKDLEAQDLQKQAGQVQDSIHNLQGRLESTPVGIKEYDQLIRDRELARADYEKIDKQVSSSDQYTKLVTRQQGERLEQLDPPTLPQTPSEPKRPIIIAIGAGLGLIIGLCLAGAREVKDTSLKNLKDVRAYTQLPVLGSIPLLENDLVVRRRKRLGILAWATACLVGVVIMSSSVVYYYATKL